MEKSKFCVESFTTEAVYEVQHMSSRLLKILGTLNLNGKSRDWDAVASRLTWP